MKSMSDGAKAKAMTMLQQLKSFVGKNGGNFVSFLREEAPELEEGSQEEEASETPEEESQEESSGSDSDSDDGDYGEGSSEGSAPPAKGMPSKGVGDKSAKMAMAIAVMKKKLGK